MKKRSTLFLKIAIIIIGTPVFILCLFLLPKIVIIAINEWKMGSQLAYVVLSILFILYVSAIPFYYALYQAFKLLQYIDHGKAFSELSVKSLQIIKRCAYTIVGLYVVSLPFLYIFAQWDDAPGLIVIGLVIIGASIIIAVFASLLQTLFTEAIDIKLENDLTV